MSSLATETVSTSETKIIKAESFFKKVSDSSSSPLAGQKRANLIWNYSGVSSEDISSLDPAKVARVLNKFIEDFGRTLIAKNSDDWTFCPSPESVTFDLAFKDFSAPRTSTRVVTKETLSALGAFYISQAPLLGVSPQASLAGAEVIKSRFKLIAGKPSALEVMSSRLLTMIEKCDEELLLPHVELIEILLAEISHLSQASDDTLDL